MKLYIHSRKGRLKRRIKYAKIQWMPKSAIFLAYESMP